jgi:long-chain-fatty-acyl-CoA reductase
MAETVHLPIIVNGDVRFPDGQRETIAIDYVDGLRVEIPAVTDEEIAEILANRERLDQLSLAEVSQFLTNGGTKWFNAADPLREESLDLCQRATGLSKAMVERDYWMASTSLMFRSVFYDLLEAELGDCHIMDEWVRRQAARVRAFPRGRALHVMVGNVPVASIYSLMRSVLTKNHSVLKLPSRDPFTTTYFVRALIEANGADHPLSRSLSVLYWPRGSTVFDRLVKGADLVVGWGQGASLEAIKGRIPHSVPYLEFGPKRSFSVVWTDGIDLDKAAMRVAHDVAAYDQEACYSPQRLFVIGEAGPLVEALCSWLDVQQRLIPHGRQSPDIESHLLRAEMEARYRGWRVHSGDGWNVIESDDPLALSEHPLSRTLFVHRIESERDVVPFIDDETQTIGIYPYDPHVLRVGELFGRSGALRVVEVGLAAYPRQGFTHDGGFPMHYFVRLVCLEAPAHYSYKYGAHEPVEKHEDFFFGASLGRRSS